MTAAVSLQLTFGGATAVLYTVDRMPEFVWSVCPSAAASWALRREASHPRAG